MLTFLKSILHGKTVADGWAGAVLQKPLAIQKYLLPTYRPTERHGSTYCSEPLALKKNHGLSYFYKIVKQETIFFSEPERFVV